MRLPWRRRKSNLEALFELFDQVAWFEEQGSRQPRFLFEAFGLSFAYVCASITTRRWELLSICCGETLVPPAEGAGLQCFVCGVPSSVPEALRGWEAASDLGRGVTELLEQVLDPLAAEVEGPALAKRLRDAGLSVEHDLRFGPGMELLLRPTAQKAYDRHLKKTA